MTTETKEWTYDDGLFIAPDGETYWPWKLPLARLNALEACAEAGRKLQAEYKAEEELNGFPFNMALRQAHADHAEALARLDAQRP